MKKILKFISSRALYFVAGIFLALAIFGIQAAWNSTVSSGQPLTSALWNDVVNKLVELDNRYCYTHYSTSLTSCVCPAGEINKKDLGSWGYCCNFGSNNYCIFQPPGSSCVDIWSSYPTSVDKGLACVCCK